MTLEPITAADALTLAGLHAASFEDGWRAADLAVLLDSPGVFGLAVRDDGAVAGFVLARIAADEAEVLTLAVAPARRRRGIARALVEAAAGSAAAGGAASLFLEVAADNAAALNLYEAAGFHRAGRRPGYYRRAAGPPVDALVLRRDLNSPSA